MSNREMKIKLQMDVQRIDVFTCPCSRVLHVKRMVPGLHWMSHFPQTDYKYKCRLVRHGTTDISGPDDRLP